jgi:hypothetical protein
MRGAIRSGGSMDGKEKHYKTNETGGKLTPAEDMRSIDLDGCRF